MSRRLLLCAAVFSAIASMPAPIDAQSIDITGTVVDSATLAAIAGASVRLVDDQSVITTTASNGTFVLSRSSTLAHSTNQPSSPYWRVALHGDAIAVTGLKCFTEVSMDAFAPDGKRIEHLVQRSGSNGSAMFARQRHAAGLLFVRIRNGVSEFALPDCGSANMIGSLGDATVGLAKLQAAYVLEVSAPGHKAKQVTAPNAGASVGTIALAGRTGPSFWIRTTSGTGRGMARYGYCGSWEQNPLAMPGQFMFAQSDNAATTGFSANDATYGVLGQSGTIDSVYKYRTSGGSWKTAAFQDTKNFDFHIVSNGPQVGTGAWGNYGFAYTRLHPLRDNNGRTTGFAKDADLYLATMPGGTTNAWLGSNFNIWEGVDGNGAKRLMVLIQRDRQLTPTAGNTNVIDDCYIGQTTVAAGTTPGANDWVGLDNVSKDPTYVGTIRNLADNDAYWIDSYIATHAVSKKVEVFMSQGAHGVPGEHNRVTLAPIAGTGAWSAADGVAGVAAPPGTGEHYLASYSNAAGFGCVAAGGIDDDVWWIWDDGVVTRISRVKKDGSVEWNPLPSLGTRMSWNAPRGFSVAPDGAVGLIDVSVQDNSPIRGRICRDGTWGAWTDMGILPNPNYYQNPLQGLAFVNGEYWFGLVSLPMNGTMEPTLVALSFSAAP